MARALILYGTSEGHTAKIANVIGDVGRQAGHEVDVVDGATVGPIDLARYDGVIVGASVHEVRHQKHVREWIRAHRAVLERVPSAFFQVCLTSVIRDAEHDRQAAEVVAHMSEETGWKPARVGYFAGALLYTKYAWWKRMLMKQISKSQGGDTDTSRDFEYTDWDQVKAWARDAFAAIGERPATAAV
jgi:menaquinone-dependent protoporphyrinogen oxidase